MSSIGLVLVAVLISGFSGAPALLFRRASRTGQCLSTVLLVAGGAAGLAGVLPALASTSSFTAFFDFGLPLGRFSLAVDAFGAIFLVPVFVVPALGAIYGLGYRDARKHPGDARRLAPFYGLLVAGMALVIVARDAIAFLLAWELMALASWFTATADSEKPEVRRSGWVYLVATHVGSLVLFAMFALWKAASGSFSLAPGLSIAPEAAGPIFILALVGFGLKAGLVPFHVWLPGAHANAPSHVSGTMSGVMIKLGMYGILRMASIMPTPEAWWGWTLLAVGCVTGVAGIAWATGQGDIKRVLAYSSVENIGIVAMGAGLALLGRSSGRPDLVLLGMGGALFHVWNHSLFKSLLFLDAGFVTHATGTRRLERLGGLAKRMPLAALLFAVGAVAISALPPLNGFAGEWLVYLGFFRGIGEGAGPELPAAAAGAAVLATIGALATAAFVRLFGTVFLGSARSDIPASAGGPSAGPGGDRAPELFMIIPMVLLGVACLVVGLAPGLALPALGRAAAEWGGLPVSGPTLPSLADFSWTLPLGLSLFGAAGLFVALFSFAARGKERKAMPTWDCGYAAPTPRMQYGASSFGEFLGRGLSFVRVTKKKARLPVGPFPRNGSFTTKSPDPVLDLALRPLVSLVGRAFPRFRVLHQGQTQLYLVYILVATVILLVFGAGSS